MIGYKAPLAIMLLALAGVAAGARPAAAQINPFHMEGAQRLSDADFKALSAAAGKLLDKPDLAEGDKESWANPNTGSSGVVIAEKPFEHAGLRCERLRYTSLGRGKPPARTAFLDWCDTPKGWKIYTR